MGLLSSETIEIECDIDPGALGGLLPRLRHPRVDIRPGDTLVLHDMPDRLHFGECRQFRARATLTRAGTLKRLWTEAAGIFELTGLYEVGFQPDEELALRPRETA